LNDFPLNANPGKSCFLYYLLLHKLSEETPVALEIPGCVLLFQDTGVESNPEDLPRGTWALTNTIERPCPTFLAASRMRLAWIVQASPLQDKRQGWRHRRNADVFIMDSFSIQEMTALRLVRLLQVFLAL
jgi:hypothetical protein